MKRLVLHIGPHKTGSTYLQGELLKNHDFLLEKGILYPNSMLEGWGHTGLVKAIKSGEVSRLSKELDQINQFEGDVILSSENFFNMGMGQISLLRKLLHFENVCIVAYYRQPTVRLLSLWHEFVKSGICKSYADFAAPHITRPIASSELNILRKIRQFQKVFENSAVSIVDYDKAVADRATAKMFFSAINSDYSIDEKWSEVNKRVNFRDVEVIRCLNGIASIRGGTLRGAKLRNSYLRNRSSLTDIVDEQLFPMMEGFMEAVSVGGTHADHLLLETINREFPDAVGRSRPLAQDVADVPLSTWLFNRGAMSALEEVYNRLSAE